MEHKFDAARMFKCEFDLFTYSIESEWTLGSGPLERNVRELYTHYCGSSKSLEGDHGEIEGDDAAF